MYEASNPDLQTATETTLNVLTIQFDEFKTEARAIFKEIGKRLNNLHKHVDKIENCQAFLGERLMALGVEQARISLLITTLRKDIDQIGDRVTEANDRFENLERDSGDETTNNAVSSEKEEQQSHEGELATLKSGFNDLQESFHV
jgi:chromosome segregation ATPase